MQNNIAFEQDVSQYKNLFKKASLVKSRLSKIMSNESNGNTPAKTISRSPLRARKSGSIGLSSRKSLKPDLSETKVSDQATFEKMHMSFRDHPTPKWNSLASLIF